MMGIYRTIYPMRRRTLPHQVNIERNVHPDRPELLRMIADLQPR
ncbi:hypothetical protein [Photorhabdus kleinii]|nr:hypothetical protein [Photorhabdus kleinii]